MTWSDVDLPGQRVRINGKGDKQREVLIFEDRLCGVGGRFVSRPELAERSDDNKGAWWRRAASEP